MKKTLCIFFVSFFLIHCKSVEKYNAHIEKPISVEKLQKDIDFVERKLTKLHPSLDWYISKEKLNNKFDSLRTQIKKPLTPNEFFYKISPIVASVRQGHMGMNALSKRYSNKESKEFKKKGMGPLSQFDFAWINNKLYVEKNKSKDSTIALGSEVVDIEGIAPFELYNKNIKTYTSDGYNTSFLPIRFSKSFSAYFVNEKGVLDSLNYTFKSRDTIYSKYIKRLKEEKKDKKVVNDSLPAKPVVTLSKAEKDANKQKAKQFRRNKRWYGYNDAKKEFNKILTFKTPDSSVAVLQIHNFSSGKYKKVYDEIFQKIKDKKATTLVIDLRNNPGGRLNEIQKLYSYLVDKEFQFIDVPEVTSRTSVISNYFNGIPAGFYPFAAPFFPIVSVINYTKTSKSKDGKYYYKLRSSKKMLPNPLHFDGKIYVLINGGSFSASCIISSNLQATKRATFVGEETGGTFNGTVAGRMPVFKLPNSKLPIRIGLMNIQPFNKTPFKGSGIIPDVEIIQTLGDRIRENDPEMEWILIDVEKSKILQTSSIIEN